MVGGGNDEGWGGRVGAAGGKGGLTHLTSSAERVGAEGRVERGGWTGEVTVEGWWSWGRKAGE